MSLTEKLGKIALVAGIAMLAYSCGGSEQNDTAPDERQNTENDVADVQYDQTARKTMSEESVGEAESKNGKVMKAFAVVNPKSDSDVVGAVTFTKVEDGVRVIADIGGLAPGKHGFHIHEHGDCSAADGSSAGGHFNPTNQKHGGPDSAVRHVGDLGNLEANEFGFAHYDRVDKVIQLNGEHSIIGKSVVIHAGEDDLKTDPSGNSGKRIGCGEIVQSDL